MEAQELELLGGGGVESGGGWEEDDSLGGPARPGGGCLAPVPSKGSLWKIGFGHLSHVPLSWRRGSA